MEEVEVKTIELDNKNYIVLDTIQSSPANIYYYLLETSENNSIQILKNSIENNEKIYISVDDENEFDNALSLFYLKHRDDNIEKN